jgi:hypothetical protein
MSELKYYKLSGKVDFKSYLIGVIIAIILSYFIGELYLFLNNKFYSFIIEEILKSDLESHSNQLGATVAKVLARPKGFIVLVVILGILIIPLLITLLLMAGLMGVLRENGKSRNKIIDFISFVILSSICFFVSNEYEITTTIDYIEFFIFCLLALILSLGTTHYFCEKCSKTYKETKFYLISDFSSEVFLENAIKKGFDKEIKYEEKEILKKDDVLNISYVELNKCDTCDAQIVKIESKIVEVDSEGKKKIKDGKKITEDLLIS